MEAFSQRENNRKIVKNLLTTLLQKLRNSKETIYGIPTLAHFCHILNTCQPKTFKKSYDESKE